MSRRASTLAVLSAFYFVVQGLAVAGRCYQRIKLNKHAAKDMASVPLDGQCEECRLIRLIERGSGGLGARRLSDLRRICEPPNLFQGSKLWLRVCLEGSGNCKLRPRYIGGVWRAREGREGRGASRHGSECTSYTLSIILNISDTF